MSDKPESRVWWYGTKYEVPSPVSDEDMKHARHVLGNLAHYTHGRTWESDDCLTILAIIRRAKSFPND